MNRLNDIGARENQMVVAPLQRFSAEVVGRQVVTLDVRPHRTIEYEDAGVEGVEVTRIAIGESSPGLRCISHVRGNENGPDA